MRNVASSSAATVGAVSRLDNEASALVRATLREILESQPFRTSRQCQDLLRYMVEHSLTGDDGSLRERVIGTVVFGRSPDYDTGEDPVVRVRAADVRKRLAQYYQKLPPGGSELHIEVLPGSYRALFSRTERTEESPVAEPMLAAHLGHAHSAAAVVERAPALSLPAEHALPAALQDESYPASVPRRKLIRAGLVALVACACLVLTWAFLQARQPLRLFWLPVTASARPALLTVGANAAYRFSSPFLEEYRRSHHLQNVGPEFFVELPPDSSVRASDLLPVKNTFVSVADVASTAQIASLLTLEKKSYDVRYAADLSFADLRNAPLILIGGFNNPWTLQLTSEMPMVLEGGDTIRETVGKKRSWTTVRLHDGSTRDDYALISRIPHSKTGSVLITAAGIGQFGTQAAGEFLTSGDKIAALVKGAPRAWQNENLQAVLHIRVIDGEPASTDVVAMAVW